MSFHNNNFKKIHEEEIVCFVGRPLAKKEKENGISLFYVAVLKVIGEYSNKSSSGSIVTIHPDNIVLNEDDDDVLFYLMICIVCCDV